MDKNRVEELEEIITTLDGLFELGEECVCPIDIDLNDSSLTRNLIKKGDIVSDNEYDALRKELAQLNPTSEVLKSVTASFVNVKNQMIHVPPMTSISKSCGSLDEKNKILADWLCKCSNELKYTKDQVSTAFSQSLKRDGVAISVYYEKGKLKQAGLRPRDGIHGEDVTENAKYVAGIPEKLPYPLTLTIRGELECKISVFDKIVEDFKKGNDTAQLSREPANPRNYTAGSIRQFDDPKITKARQISFTAYGIENLDNPPYSTEIERAKWCNQSLGIPFVRVMPFKYADLAKIESLIDDLDYEIDGVVISVDNLKDQEALGRHGDRPTGNPRGKLAWKFAEQEAYPIIKEIIWQTGRTGKVTPVAQFDFVKLAGTKVSQCTLHNVGIVQASRLGVGAKIVVIKSGKIIPKVIGVKTPANKIEIPENCASCGQKLTLEKNGNVAELFCKNKSCIAQNIGRLTNFLDKIGAKGIGESRINELISCGLVKNISDLFKLSYNDVITKSQLTERQTLLVLAQLRLINAPEKIKDNAKLILMINKIKKISLSAEKFLSAVNIEGVGSGGARLLVETFNSDLDRIRVCNKDELLKIDGIGPVMAEEIVKFFAEQKDEIDNLLKFIELEVPKTGKLSGLKFCFTGELPEDRKILQAKVEELGGICPSSVSKKVNFLVVGENPGSKLDKANKLKIKILDYEKFKEFLE